MLYLSNEILEELVRKRVAHLKANSVLDHLFKMKMQGDMATLIASLQVKLDDYVKKNPDKDVVEQQLLIDYMEEIQRWMALVWNEALQLDAVNRYLTELLLRKELQIRDKDVKIQELEQELVNLKENIS